MLATMEIIEVLTITPKVYIEITETTGKSELRVLGNTFKNKIEDWRKEKDKTYPLRRTSFEYKPQDYRNKKQQNMSFHCINTEMDIWEGAGWSGCGFVFDQLRTMPPIFGLAFENLERGKQIIAEWKAKSEKGERSVLIYIIRGIDKENPISYRVCAAPDMKKDELKEGRCFASMCRKHIMTPNTNWNLDTFERLYKQFGGCWFTAFQIDYNKQIIMPENFKDTFKFTTIEFRNAWEIRLDDMAILALEPDDEPFIPEDKKIQLLYWRSWLQFED